jgi:mono/diheme cytochrome c family protein
MNRRAVTVTLALMLVLAAASAQVWASEGPVGEEIPAEIKSMTNPQQMTPASLKTGTARYEKNCAGCHGDSGRGDGPLADALPEKPTDLTDTDMLDEHTDGELFYKIKEGVGEYMPGYEDQLPDEDIWDIVNYLRSAGASEGAGETPKAAAAGKDTAPRASPEEFRALENPVLDDHTAVTGGKEVYALYCYRCHGPNGQGSNGSYAQSVLTEPAPDLSDPALLSKMTDGELFYTIKFGSGEMPSHEEYLHDEEIWQTVNYIRTFEGKVHDTTTQEKSNTTLYGAIFLIAVLIIYVVKRRR